MKLLLTNDDGFDAPGIAALAVATRGIGTAQIIAPVGPQSGCGHRVTTHAPVRVIGCGDGHFAVDGTPADCVLLGLNHLSGPVDWVVSGINAGGNLGIDTHHSGTVAAVRQAVFHGIKGVAVSQYIARGRSIDWDRAAQWTARVLRELFSRPIPPETFWNVNLPHPGPDVEEPGIVYCQVDPSPQLIVYREESGGWVYSGDYQGRPRRPGWDIDVCFGGRISVSLVHPMASAERFD